MDVFHTSLFVYYIQAVAFMSLKKASSFPRIKLHIIVNLLLSLGNPTLVL